MVVLCGTSRGCAGTNGGVGGGSGGRSIMIPLVTDSD